MSLRNTRVFLFLMLLSISSVCFSQTNKSLSTNIQRTPIMGWASWNNFRANINEDIIRSQADFMASSAMKDAGYTFINVDDGYMVGRDADGNILTNSKKFPSGMKALADYIHSKQLKAGIYSDAGINTCVTYWDKDTSEVDMGLYNHEEQDLTLML